MAETVYVFRTGRCYHRRFRCSAVMWFHWTSDNLTETGIAGARGGGYSPCSRCCPDEHANRLVGVVSNSGEREDA